MLAVETLTLTEQQGLGMRTLKESYKQVHVVDLFECSQNNTRGYHFHPTDEELTRVGAPTNHNAPPAHEDRLCCSLKFHVVASESVHC